MFSLGKEMIVSFYYESLFPCSIRLMTLCNTHVFTWSMDVLPISYMSSAWLAICLFLCLSQWDYNSRYLCIGFKQGVLCSHRWPIHSVTIQFNPFSYLFLCLSYLFSTIYYQAGVEIYWQDQLSPVRNVAKIDWCKIKDINIEVYFNLFLFFHSSVSLISDIHFPSDMWMWM